MRHIYEISNESSPGTKENWYEVYDESKECDHVAIFHTREELEIYLEGLGRLRDGVKDWDTNKYEYEIIPYESNE